MIFEKPLMKRVSSWKISANKFIFQETRDSPDVYVVRLDGDTGPRPKSNDEHEIITNTAPVVFKFSNAAFANSLHPAAE